MADIPGWCGSRQAGMKEAEPQKVRVIAADEAAVSETVRRLEVWTCALCAAILAVTCAVFFVWTPADSNAVFRHLLKWLFFAWLILLGLIYLVIRVRLLKTGVVLGDGFIAGPRGRHFVARVLGRRTTLAYRDITRVNLAVANGRIAGATVGGKGKARVHVRRVTDPATVVRAIREHAGPEVTWHTSSAPPAKLNPSEVDALIGRENES